MGKILKGMLIGGLVAWLWLIASWTFLPWHCASFQRFLNEAEVSQVLFENTPHSGLYHLPSSCAKETPSEDFDKGPVIFASVQRYGASFTSFVPYALFLGVQCLGALLIFLILLMAKRLHYGAKVCMTTFIGIAIGVLGHFPEWVWLGFPFHGVWISLCDTTIAWFLAGLFMAALAKAKPPPPPPQTSDKNTHK